MCKLCPHRGEQPGAPVRGTDCYSRLLSAHLLSSLARWRLYRLPHPWPPEIATSGRHSLWDPSHSFIKSRTGSGYQNEAGLKGSETPGTMHITRKRGGQAGRVEKVRKHKGGCHPMPPAGPQPCPPAPCAKTTPQRLVRAPCALLVTRYPRSAALPRLCRGPGSSAGAVAGSPIVTTLAPAPLHSGNRRSPVLYRVQLRTQFSLHSSCILKATKTT